VRSRPSSSSAWRRGSQPATGGATCTLAGALNVGGNLTLNSGTLDVGAGPAAVSVGGSWLNQGGRFTPRSGTVTMNGAGAGNEILCGGQPFNDLTFSGTGAWSCSDPLQVNGAFSQSQGSFTAPSSRLEVGGSFSRTGGTFVHNSGTLLLRPSGARTMNSGGATFNHVVVNDGLAGYWKLDDGAGAVAADASGYGRSATLVNSPTWDAAARPDHRANPSSLAFNGTTQSGNAAVDLSGTNVVTLAFWLNWAAYANDDKLAFEFGNSPSGFNGLTTGFIVNPNSSSFRGNSRSRCGVTSATTS
jgi:hypothetical protein